MCGFTWGWCQETLSTLIFKVASLSPSPSSAMQLVLVATFSGDPLSSLKLELQASLHVSHLAFKWLFKEENLQLWKSNTWNSSLSFLTTFSGEGKWLRNIDYYRLDGSTNAQSRKKWALYLSSCRDGSCERRGGRKGVSGCVKKINRELRKLWVRVAQTNEGSSLNPKK